MFRLNKKIQKETVKHAALAIAVVALAVFVVLPAMPQVHSNMTAIALKAGIIHADDGGDAGGSGGAGSDGGSAGGDAGGSSGAGSDGTSSGDAGGSTGAGTDGGASSGTSGDAGGTTGAGSTGTTGTSADAGGTTGIGTEGPGCCGGEAGSSGGADSGTTGTSADAGGTTGIGTEGPGCCGDTGGGATGGGGDGGTDNPPPPPPEPDAPTCTLSANPNNLPFGGGNTVLSWTTDNASSVSIDQGVGSVSLDGLKSTPVSTSKTYTLTATGAGGTVSCHADVTVHVPPPPHHDDPTCTLSATPNNLPYGGGDTTLTWTSHEALSASLTDVGTVVVNGSRGVHTTIAKTYVLTVTGYDGRIAHCETPVTVAAPYQPVCTLSASPTSFPFGGGNTVLSWTTDNASSVSIDQGVGALVLDGTKSVAVTMSKTFTLSAMGPGGNVTCYASVIVAPQPLPTCTLSASPNNLPYGGGTASLVWNTTNANTISIDQGIGNVSQTGSVNASVASTKTYTLTATNQTGSVNCTAPVTVGAPSQPTCALSVDPSTVETGGQAHVNWSSTNVTHVTITQIIANAESSLQDTNAGQGSTVISPTTNTTYKGVFTGPGGSIQCQSAVVVHTPPPPLTPSCDSFTASPSTLVGAGNTVLNWTTTNADAVSIDGGVGTVALDGSVSTAVSASKTFTLTATKGAQSISCRTSVTVNPVDETAPSCDAFSVSPSSGESGTDATMTWNTSNADSVSINQGIGSVSVDGSRSITIDTDKTYTLTATKGSKTISCATSVSLTTVTHHHGGGGSSSPTCDIFEASDRSVTPGSTVDLHWKTRYGTKLKIGPGNIFSTSDSREIKNGEVTVRPTRDTRYTLTVSRGNDDDTCSVNVDVNGYATPLPLTSVAFTEIPYTGFDAGPFLTGLFYALLALWSFAIAYVLVVKRGSVFGFSLPFTSATTSGAHGGGVIIPAQEYTQHLETAHVAETTPVAHEPEIFTVHSTPAPVVQSYIRSVAEAPANLPVMAEPLGYAAHAAAFGSVATTEDEDEAGVDSEAEEPEEDDNNIESHLENIAHRESILLSSDALRAIIDQGETTEESEAHLREVITRAKASYPREDGWIILNRERLNTLFKAEVPASVATPVVDAKVEGATTLAEAIVTGNTTLAYQMLGTSPLLAIADAAEEIDSVIRARKDGSVVAHDLLVRASATISDEKLKSAVSALVSAIDGTYADETAAVRLAVIKALKAVA